MVCVWFVADLLVKKEGSPNAKGAEKPNQVTLGRDDAAP